MKSWNLKAIDPFRMLPPKPAIIKPIKKEPPLILNAREIIASHAM
jgi:hypothetical protein